MVYELVIMFVPAIRLNLSLTAMGSKGSDEITRFFNDCDFGDWFILNQIGKNTERKFYREFIKALATRKAKASQDKKDQKDVDNNLVEITTEDPKQYLVEMRTF